MITSSVITDKLGSINKYNNIVATEFTTAVRDKQVFPKEGFRTPAYRLDSTAVEDKAVAIMLKVITFLGIPFNCLRWDKLYFEGIFMHFLN
jgi:hypothetical protein